MIDRKNIKNLYALTPSQRTPRTEQCATIETQSTGAKAMELTAILTSAEEGGYVALNPETGTTTQGETIEEAIAISSPSRQRRLFS